MFHYITGKLVELKGDFAVIDCGGIGYGVMISALDYEKLSSLGAFAADGSCTGINVKMYTFVKLVDETRFEIFGFTEKKALNMFGLLQTVSGIGTRAAIAILSVLDTETICSAIASDNTKLIATAQGVGQKAAQKICIDLKNKLDKFMLENGVGFGDGTGSTTQGAPEEENLEENQILAAEALTNLGYTRAQANKAVKNAGGGSVEDIIRKALAALF